VTTAPPVLSLPPRGPHPPPWQPNMPQQARSWSGLTAFVISPAAVSVAMAAWFRPLPASDTRPAPSLPAFADQQVAEATSHVYAAFKKVDHALDLSSPRNGGNDPPAFSPSPQAGGKCLTSEAGTCSRNWPKNRLLRTSQSRSGNSPIRIKRRRWTTSPKPMLWNYNCHLMLVMKRPSRSGSCANNAS
jgi:hypothetical protein